MIRRTPIKRSGPPKKTNPARRRKETSSLPWKQEMKAERLRRKREKEARDYARKYGSVERVKFVQGLPCAACQVEGYSDNAHLLGNEGTGRKAGYETIGPLCGPQQYVRRYFDGKRDFSPFIGCHRQYDEFRGIFDAAHPDFDPEKVARETEELFRASLGSSPGGQT